MMSLPPSKCRSVLKFPLLLSFAFIASAQTPILANIVQRVMREPAQYTPTPDTEKRSPENNHK